jgi:CRISPR-associated protein Cas1
MEAIIKGVSSSIGYVKPIIFHIRNQRHTVRFREGDRFPLDLLFFQASNSEIERWRTALIDYLADPGTGRNYALHEAGTVEERSYSDLLRELGRLPVEGEVCLEFLTPFPFKRSKKTFRTYLDKGVLIEAFESRFSRLFGRSVKYSPGDDNFYLLPYYWNYTEYRHQSHSQPGQIQLINGCTGKLYIKGRFSNLLSFLILGSELHAGAKLSNAQGYYLLQGDSPGYFESHFPRKKAIISIIREVIERYDNALETLSSSEGIPFSEETYANKILSEIVSGSYTPAPNTAFHIKKKKGTDRLVEQPSLKDLIVQQYLLRTLSSVFDRMFEEESIGFRKGISRQKAIEMVQSAISGGFQYVIESDIEDFFPSVNLGVLSKLLDHYIPSRDNFIKGLLLKTIQNGYILNGVFYPRTKGIAQGSPLSPLLANIYLDSFDEEVRGWNVKLIRYADDFIIMASSKEEAEQVLSRTESFLSTIGLRIKKDKTAIRHIGEGFQFLGMKFGRTEVTVSPEEEIKKLRKPLYITEPYLFLSLNGEAIDIKKERKVIETIPVRRISEIIAMEKAVFSTALVQRCTEENIPFTITLGTGYFITTIKPDSKRYYDVACEHGRRYQSLTDTEILSIAKEFAATKLENFVSLFAQRYAKGEYLFLAELGRVIEKIHGAGDIQEVRGLEGSATKKIYSHLNEFIDDKDFHIKKRERKKPDRINSLLNFGFYLLFSRINATVRAVGLNPYLGFLHAPEDNYESLVADIQELFRANICRFIIKIVNLKSIGKEDFTESDRGFYLGKAKKTFLAQFEAEMERKPGKNTLSLKENIYAQTMVIKNYILESKLLSFYRWKK